jgi:hypothetical protein
MEMIPYTFNEPLKITLCSPLQLGHKECLIGRKLENKLAKFDCEKLKENYPLECLTNELENQNTSKIIRLIRECDHSFIFGSNLRLIKYKKIYEDVEDVELNQNIISEYEADFNVTYLNSGDYCSTFTFSKFKKDLEKNLTERKKMLYQFSIEKVMSPIKIYVNQHKTNYTFFNFHQVQFRGANRDYWKLRNEDMKNKNLDLLDLEIENFTKIIDDPLETTTTFDQTFDSSTIDTIINNKLENNLNKTKTIENYIPVQNLTIYVNILHTRIIKLRKPYESACLNYFAERKTINNKRVKSREECLVTCYKYYVNYYKFLYLGM